MRIPLLLASAVFALQSAPASAWGPTGHRVTGEIAERNLDADTKAKIAGILGPESIAEASNWPDFMRSDESSFWQDESPNYHYVTIPEGMTYAEVGPPPQGDAITALAKYTATVKDANASLAARQEALRFVIHIIEDLHQPLHVGNGRDLGGNTVKVNFMDEPTNLHSVWDEDIINAELLSYSEWADWLNRRITAEDHIAWAAAKPAQWLAESVAIRDGLYPAPSEDPSSSELPDLSYDYVYAHKPQIDLRLQQGGIRLAAYLNNLFAE
ncbi:S1/P1 nuclease [Pontixanthobacter gangjinensis]|uniref:S1/P1 Nuclease n=1 Tax=Pontixanthobacter gangjinensis TaxID=1028742 RepID=A0A6I4SL45_9SPHN|nr:S1/P1 nuclease [Pontixanthobacter gangjinensis]MXO55860.1 S1/P1 Nuclease [Pontixanthobacter gangjinensis]